jgi:hypothetical protein
MKIDREYPDSLLIDDYFKNHKITLHGIIGTEIGRLEYMRWQKPGSWNCGVDYLVRSGNLIVTGDLGYAIYCWYDNKVSLEWIAGLNLGYFHEKCQASENGRYGCGHVMPPRTRLHLLGLKLAFNKIKK